MELKSGKGKLTGSKRSIIGLNRGCAVTDTEMGAPDHAQKDRCPLQREV